LEEKMAPVKGKDPALLLKIVENCCRIKKSIVEIDEKEQGLRRILNYGHTLGHALEAQSNFTLAHGEAVALGMIAAARISENSGYLDQASRERIERIVGEAGLPVRIPQDMATEGILSRLKMDKKKEGDLIHFVLLKKIGMPFVNGGVDDKIIIPVIEGMKS
ncbi:MAG TPA: 3-dehydroquinate synthase, partial [Smithellaceae bacterium]|nr:3-dehydroquinate synthase [Smithellaceae bacterium]